MISSAGNLSVSRQAVEKHYGSIISQLALKRFGVDEVYSNDVVQPGSSPRISKWLDGAERQNLIAGLIVGFATFAAGTSASSDKSSATYFFKVPSTEKKVVASDWAKQELMFWQSLDSAELLALTDELQEEAADALSRMLPANMSLEQARDWALELVKSVKG